MGLNKKPKGIIRNEKKRCLFYRASVNNAGACPGRSGCGEYEFIRLSSFVSKLFEAKNGIEPRGDFKVFDDYTEFSASAEYDFASLAVSPRYSPAEADVLVNVIKEYFDLI